MLKIKKYVCFRYVCLNFDHRTDMHRKSVFFKYVNLTALAEYIRPFNIFHDTCLGLKKAAYLLAYK